MLAHPFFSSPNLESVKFVSIYILYLFINSLSDLFMSFYSKDPPGRQDPLLFSKKRADFFFPSALRLTVQWVNAAQSTCIIWATCISAIEKLHFPSSAWFIGRKCLVVACSVTVFFFFFPNVHVNVHLCTSVYIGKACFSLLLHILFPYCD